MVDVDNEDYAQELKAAKQREQELIRQQYDNEAAFSQQRAKFMELFGQKEGEFVLICGNSVANDNICLWPIF